MDDVALVMPHIPTRNVEIHRALRSAMVQTHPVSELCISRDVHRQGSAVTRNRALYQARAKWTGFLDDDDEWLENHVELLLDVAVSCDADVVYSGCRVIGSYGQEIPLREEWGRYGDPFNADLLRERSYIPVTSLVRTELAQEVGGFQYPKDSIYDDWGFYLAMLDAGARFLHLPRITWVWHHHGKNTSGQPDRW